MPDDSDDPESDSAMVLLDAIRELTFLHEFIQENPTFSDRWGTLTTKHSEYPRLPENSELKITGEREFWFRYGKYVAGVQAARQTSDLEHDLPPYNRIYNRFGGRRVSSDDLPDP